MSSLKKMMLLFTCLLVWGACDQGNNTPPESQNPEDSTPVSEQSTRPSGTPHPSATEVPADMGGTNVEPPTSSRSGP